MIRFELKKSRNTKYYYLTERILVEGKYKKIQVFIGKNVPNDTRRFFAALKEKELALVAKTNPHTDSLLLPIQRTN